MAKNDYPNATENFRDRANSAFSQFGEEAASQVDNSPLIALAGGIALGAILAAVLPQSARELGLLQPVGTKVADAGRGAVDKAKQATKSQFDEFAGDKVREYFGVGSTTPAA